MCMHLNFEERESMCVCVFISGGSHKCARVCIRVYYIFIFLCSIRHIEEEDNLACIMTGSVNCKLAFLCVCALCVRFS